MVKRVFHEHSVQKANWRGNQFLKQKFVLPEFSLKRTFTALWNLPESLIYKILCWNIKLSLTPYIEKV